MAFVGADFVMRVARGFSPIPHRNHQIPLDTLWTRRYWRQFACCDPVGPIREHLDGAFLVDEPGKCAAHPVSAGLAEVDARSPRFRGRLEIESAQVREIPCVKVTQLVTLLAALLHYIDPLFLCGDGTQRECFLIRHSLLAS